MKVYKRYAIFLDGLCNKNSNKILNQLIWVNIFFFKSIINLILIKHII
jgi:hypothetical protein